MRYNHAANVSTEETKEEKGARIPQEDVDDAGARRASPQAAQRKKSDFSVGRTRPLFFLEPFGVGTLPANRRQQAEVNRKYSLKKNRDFQYIYRRGKAKGSKSMLLLFIAQRTGPVAVGFCVSKKIGNSVVRNRVKRRMKEAFRPEIEKLRPGSRMVFIARPPLAEAEFEQIRKTMQYLLKKSGMFKEEGV